LSRKETTDKIRRDKSISVITAVQNNPQVSFWTKKMPDFAGRSQSFENKT
jgi:hypothetical protein